MSFTASPAVRAYAGANDVDLEELARTTGRTVLAREDVESALSGAGRPEPSAHGTTDAARYWSVDHARFGPVTEEPVSRMGQAAADNLSAANALIPQVTHHDRADMRAVEVFRIRLKDEATARGIRLTALAFHVKALARCLTDFPRFNASLSPDGMALTLKHYIHIGIAVDTPRGLVVPVIRDAGAKGLWAIAAGIADLAARAQDRKIREDDLGGASISISNLGGIGGTGFTPIVNPPEVAILGLTRTEPVPVPDGDTWITVPMTPLSLSYDHRVVNGADAARFLARHAQLIAEPRRLLVS